MFSCEIIVTRLALEFWHLYKLTGLMMCISLNCEVLLVVIASFSYISIKPKNEIFQKCIIQYSSHFWLLLHILLKRVFIRKTFNHNVFSIITILFCIRSFLSSPRRRISHIHSSRRLHKILRMLQWWTVFVWLPSWTTLQPWHTCLWLALSCRM